MTQQMSPTRPGHVHGPNCGHVQIEHEGHVDYLDEGKLVPSGAGWPGDRARHSGQQAESCCLHSESSLRPT